MVNPPRRSHLTSMPPPSSALEGGCNVVSTPPTISLTDLDGHMLTDKGYDRFDI